MKKTQIDTLLGQLRQRGDQRTLHRAVPEGKYIIDEEGRRLLNFSSNDYLGLTSEAIDPALGLSGAALQEDFFRLLGDHPPFMMSNPSSRLMSGNIPEYERLESALAALWPGNRTALVLNSGYTVNAGALAALTAKGDLLVADHAVHASLMDGLRLCEAEWVRFRHNDMNHLEQIVRKNRDRYRNVWVVTESVFSMDGDCAPLRQIVELKGRYDLQIFLDEAHSFGLWAANGAGYAHHLGVSERIDVIAAAMGKALASSGGFLLMDAPVRELLVNRMRTLIFATAIPAVNLLWSLFLTNRLAHYEPRRAHLRRLTNLLTESTGATQIVPIPAGDSARAVEMARRLREAGFWTTAIRHPTVPRGRERVRVSLNAAVTEDEILRFRQAWQRIDATL